MQQAGCIYVHFGVESGSNEILKTINKEVTIEEVCHKVKFARNIGLEVACSFSIGHPDDTEETIKETIQLIKELQSFGASISTSIVTPFPGTKLWRERDRFGINIETTDWQRYNLFTPVMSTRHLTSKQIELLFVKLLAETSGYVGIKGGK